MGELLIVREGKRERRRRGRGPAVAVLACGLLAGCANTGASDPAKLAEAITRAVYANDLDATVANFDDETKKSVSRSELGSVSDRMHALGDLTALAPRSANADTGRYAYDARFTNGAMLVEMRLDPSGKVGAYRVTPEAAQANPGR